MSLTPKDVEIMRARSQFERALFGAPALRPTEFLKPQHNPPKPAPLPQPISSTLSDAYGRFDRGFTSARPIPSNPPNAARASIPRGTIASGGTFDRAIDKLGRTVDRLTGSNAIPGNAGAIGPAAPMPEGANPLKTALTQSPNALRAALNPASLGRTGAGLGAQAVAGLGAQAQNQARARATDQLIRAGVPEPVARYLDGVRKFLPGGEFTPQHQIVNPSIAQALGRAGAQLARKLPGLEQAYKNSNIPDWLNPLNWLDPQPPNYQQKEQKFDFPNGARIQFVSPNNGFQTLAYEVISFRIVASGSNFYRDPDLDNIIYFTTANGEANTMIAVSSLKVLPPLNGRPLPMQPSSGPKPPELPNASDFEPEIVTVPSPSPANAPSSIKPNLAPATPASPSPLPTKDDEREPGKYPQIPTAPATPENPAPLTPPKPNNAEFPSLPTVPVIPIPARVPKPVGPETQYGTRDDILNRRGIFPAKPATKTFSDTPAPDPVWRPTTGINSPVKNPGITQAPEPGLSQGPPIPPRPPVPPAPGRCRDGCSQKILDNQEAAKNNLDKLSAGLQVADLALLNTINTKLGDQLPGGIGGKLTRLSKWLHLDRALNVLIYVNTLHNAYMLSNGLSQTLFSMTANVLAVFGIKDAEDNPLDIGKIIGSTIDAFAKSILGVETVDGIKAEWKKFSRIYQAAANILWSVQSIGQSILSVLEIVGSNVAKIGNALRKWGVVGETAFGWMNATPNYQNRFFTGLEKVENVTSQIDSAASETLSARETFEQLGKQKTDLDKAMTQTEDSKQGKESPEAAKTKETEAKNKTDSQPPTISVESERKPES